VNNPTGLHVLIHKSADGDKQAQIELYSMVSQPLLQYILNRFTPTINEEDAEEITQQAVIQIYAYASQFEGEHNDASAWRWAYQIARNQALKWIRTLKKTISIWETAETGLDDDEYVLFDAKILLYSPISPEDALEDQVMNKLIWEAARESLSELPEREREMLIMRYVKDLTLEEIAHHYHIKRPRVHQILASIHHKLRKAAKLDEL
jgi:RNA polymerase sigma-70 factor (ECF subfamily)